MGNIGRHVRKEDAGECLVEQLERASRSPSASRSHGARASGTVTAERPFSSPSSPLRQQMLRRPARSSRSRAEIAQARHACRRHPGARARRTGSEAVGRPCSYVRIASSVDPAASRMSASVMLRRPRRSRCPAFSQVRQALGEPPISRSRGRRSSSRRVRAGRGATRPRWSSVGDEVERAPRVGDRRRPRRQHPGESGPVHRDRGRQAARTPPRPRRPSRRASAAPTRVPPQRPHPPLAGLQELLDARRARPSRAAHRRSCRSGRAAAGQSSRGGPRASGAVSSPAALAAHPGTAARSGRPLARSPRPAIAWRIASDGSPFCSYQLARPPVELRHGSGRSSSRRACSTSANRWW